MAHPPEPRRPSQSAAARRSRVHRAEIAAADAARWRGPWTSADWPRWCTPLLDAAALAGLEADAAQSLQVAEEAHRATDRAEAQGRTDADEFRRFEAAAIGDAFKARDRLTAARMAQCGAPA